MVDWLSLCVLYIVVLGFCCVYLVCLALDFGFSCLGI